MTVGTPMELKDLEYFIAAADAGNFTRAAQSLKLHPSTISRHVGRLEDELGLLLFERNRPGVRLSAGGRAVAQLTRKVLTDLDSIRKIAGLSGIAEFGELRLGLRLPPLGKPLSALLSNWATSHPNIVLKITEMHDRDIVFAIEERRLDVAVVLGHTKWPRAASKPAWQGPETASSRGLPGRSAPERRIGQHARCSASGAQPPCPAGLLSAATGSVSEPEQPLGTRCRGGGAAAASVPPRRTSELYFA